MMRYLALSAWLLSATLCSAGVGRVQWAEVEVRSGASDRYYPTAKLKKGEAVVILGEQNKFLKIQPPAGSFSYVQKEAVQVGSDPRLGEIIAEDVPLRAGSALDDKAAHVTTRKLQAGEKVTILGEAVLRLGANAVTFYRVQPEQDFRFVLKEAIEIQEDKAAGTAPGPAPREPSVTPPPDQEPTLPPGTPAEEVNKTRAAHRAYVAGKSSRDFREARRLFTELAGSRNTATRSMALNYLEYVRQWEQGMHRSGYPQPPRATSSYTYGPDMGPQRPAASDRIPPTTLPPAPPSDMRPPATNPPRTWTGLLNASGRRMHRGWPLYAIVDGRGDLKCYVTSTSTNLEPYVGRAVEVVGQGVYEKDLRGDVVQATQIKPMNTGK